MGGSGSKPQEPPPEPAGGGGFSVHMTPALLQRAGESAAASSQLVTATRGELEEQLQLAFQQGAEYAANALQERQVLCLASLLLPGASSCEGNTHRGPAVRPTADPPSFISRPPCASSRPLPLCGRLPGRATDQRPAIASHIALHRQRRGPKSSRLSWPGRGRRRPEGRPRSPLRWRRCTSASTGA
jgi:hypothetical protein